MGISLQEYIKDVWKRSPCSNNSNQIKSDNFELCDLRTGGRRSGIIIPAERGPTPRGGNVMSREAIKVRAVMVCRAIEGWMSNLGLHRGQPLKWEEDKCKITNLGVPNGGRDEKKCPRKDQLENWQAFDSSTPLYLQQERHCTFRACIDLMSIFFNIYSEYNSSKLKEAQATGTKICQEISEGLSKWGGQEVANRIMEEWFLRTPGKVSNSYIRMSDGEPLSQTLSILLNQMGFPILGVQCTKEQDSPSKFQDSCVYTAPGQCEIMGGDEEAEAQVTRTGVISEKIINQVKQREEETSGEGDITKQTEQFRRQTETSARAVEEKLRAGRSSFNVYMPILGTVLPLLGIAVFIYMRKRGNKRHIIPRLNPTCPNEEQIIRPNSRRGVITYRGSRPTPGHESVNIE
ncbi:hypothetical protein C922_05593 [Plasmodium inui San Antonio 1]|uniref:Uncharacterized protein n=1 Tax=Plasmodium inui San Antonio 1 TaxID=1237626 RepID=W6ZT14_9APIC|nr:hypothetical protein C922_05593 [Plasmodium inui San Antonio 1]EUD64027.1 hypothetical protein C922_05593 [Plasmodium inui San Antonio 1]